MMTSLLDGFHKFDLYSLFLASGILPVVLVMLVLIYYIYLLLNFVTILRLLQSTQCKYKPKPTNTGFQYQKLNLELYNIINGY